MTPEHLEALAAELKRERDARSERLARDLADVLARAPEELRPVLQRVASDVRALETELLLSGDAAEWAAQMDQTDTLQRDLHHVLARVPRARLRATDADLQSIADANRTDIERAREKRKTHLDTERERHRAEARRLRESPNDLDDTAIARVLTNKFPRTPSGRPRRPFSRQYVARLLGGPRRPRRRS